ncbi:hypothetical protein NQ318_020461 [Aromia moschata]|uniref:Uncharacterized protein n=1 Tax=Aromia moschata TaxID=1265417 RepID=A0AAV8YJ20_9CUCU|nr:hypothetical protein NQ318_020461 [Aromia moschata]
MYAVNTTRSYLKSESTEMDTPITVSSSSTEPNTTDFLQLDYSTKKHDESVISLDSTSFDRVPVSWGAESNKFMRTESNTTLANIQKVSNWIKSIEGEERKSDTIVADLDKSSPYSESNKTDLMEPTGKNDGNDSKSEINESQEFSRDAGKKELERKIKQSEIEDINQPQKEVEKCAMLKSFKELNIRVEKTKFSRELFEEKVKALDLEKYSFCFPFPSKKLTEQISDFDSTMAELVPRYKRICKLQNLKLNSKLNLKKIYAEK